MIEFEVKAPVPDADVERVRRALGPAERVVEQVDTYLAHPQRDFASTDEALRLRRVGGATELTYKGPKMDATTKARREIAVTVGDYDGALAIFVALGFSTVADVRKTRSIHDFDGLEACLDVVDGLGTFLELERQLPDGASLEEARADVAAALDRLGLQETQRLSYLELILRSRKD